MDMNNALAMAKEMREKLHQQEQALRTLQASGEAGLGQVKITLDGSYAVLDVHIDKQALADGDAQLLADMVKAAANQARDKMHALQREKMSALALNMGFDNSIFDPSGK